jgi:predicted DCC family thiol-disulfide oxidoreductase YuxK
MIVLFDGYCVLCSGFARWLKKRFSGNIRLVAMQSDDGQELLGVHGFSSGENDEVVVIEKDNSLSGAPAILYILKQSGAFPRMLYHFLKIFPGSLIKAGYRVVANNRYGWFGRRDSCTIIQD